MDAELVFRMFLIAIAVAALVAIVMHYNKCITSGASPHETYMHPAPGPFERYENSEESRSDEINPESLPLRPQGDSGPVGAVEESIEELPAPVAGPPGGYAGPLKAEDLLPKLTPEAEQFAQLYPCGQGDLSGMNFIESVGQSTNLKRNSNMQLRSDPPIPYKNVSPWQMSTIRPDCHQRTFELGQS